MTRIKKTRTEKSIGAAKKPLLKQSERVKLHSKKKGKGRPSGAKANIDGAAGGKKNSGSGSNKKPIDVKIGSKKPIELILNSDTKSFEPKVTVKKAKAAPELSPQQQLENIENDTRLNDLLDRIDAGETLSPKDEAYIDHQTAHHQKLIKTLGIDDQPEEDEQEEPESQEAWQQIDSSEFDEFKRK